MFVTAKGNHLVEVWKFPFTGNEQAPLRHSTFDAGQVNGIVVDQATDRLFVATGAKWNLTRTWLLNTNVLFRVTDAGLRSRVTPSVSLDYVFER